MQHPQTAPMLDKSDNNSATEHFLVYGYKASLSFCLVAANRGPSGRRGGHFLPSAPHLSILVVVSGADPVPLPSVAERYTLHTMHNVHLFMDSNSISHFFDFLQFHCMPSRVRRTGNGHESVLEHCAIKINADICRPLNSNCNCSTTDQRKTRRQTTFDA